MPLVFLGAVQGVSFGRWEKVDIVDVRKISPADIQKRYVEAGVPVILENLVTQWPAYKRWTKDYFRTGAVGRRRLQYNKLRLLPFRNASSLRDFRTTKVESTLGQMIDRMATNKHKDLFFQLFPQSHPITDFIYDMPELLDAVRIQDVEDRLWGPDGPKQGNFHGLGRMDYQAFPWVPPYPPQLFIASKDVYTVGHFDGDLSHTFHWTVWGLKSVVLLKRTRLPAIQEALANLKMQDMRKYWHDHTPYKRRGWRTLIRPGQVLLMPSQTWHWYAYEEDSLSFVMRARSFTDMATYCRGYMDGFHKPSKILPQMSRLWNESFATPNFTMHGGQLPPPPCPSTPGAAPCAVADPQLGHDLVSCPMQVEACTHRLVEHACGALAPRNTTATVNATPSDLHTMPFCDSSRRRRPAKADAQHETCSGLLPPSVHTLARRVAAVRHAHGDHYLNGTALNFSFAGAGDR